MNLAKKEAIRYGEAQQRMESKTDSWGREKHGGKQVALLEKQRVFQRRMGAWRKVNNAYRVIQGKAPAK